MTATETPLMKQYYSIKAKHPDAILLFRVGDFYETFEEDAVKTARILGITLTKRANGSAAYIDLAGFPHHALDTYLPKLVRAGERVAICEQLEDPKLAKKIVKRGITEVVTPGISINDNVLENKQNNFLAAVYLGKLNIIGVAFLDHSTGEFLVSQGNLQYVDKLMQSFKPKEVIFEKRKKQYFLENFSDFKVNFGFDDWVFTFDYAFDKLTNHFKTTSLKGFGIENLDSAVIAAGAVLEYLDHTNHTVRDHITGIARVDEDNYMWLDKFTIRNLELIYPLHEKGKSLLDVIDNTVTPMGGRLLRRWISLPLKSVEKINERLNVVEAIVSDDDLRDFLHEKLSLISDLERLASKIAVLRINPRELLAIKNSLEAIASVKNILSNSENPYLQAFGEKLYGCEELVLKITQSINLEAPAILSKGNFIAENFNQELDELRKLAYGGKDYLENLEKLESERTGITSLKIGFNNVFGYYFEVRNTHKDKVPETWIRKQTLVSAERYINEELKEYEEKILGAEEKIQSLELKLYNEILEFASNYITKLQQNANLIAKLDCLLSFSKSALENNYVKPEVNESLIIDIKEGRHPVIEKQLPPGEVYVSNSVYLDDQTQQIMMLTGPNMSGKSALLRQTALICILAQIGSFVPAESASIGVVDKVFTRVGASDNISMGESTFMVEMIEAASIMNNISQRSLILLDEIGRGTSTYDGISIAWSIAEFIHEHPTAKAKTLFATHYHELNEMEKYFPRIKNFNVSVQESKEKIIFLRKIKPGGSEHSFGIHVAQMAGMPKSIVYRARKILEQLEGKTKDFNVKNELSKPVEKIAQHREGYQLSIFQLEDPVLSQIRKEIRNFDIDRLTPLEALNKLNEIKKICGL
ncbi:MAG TPA: DNA mismatch repair protein MutS [Bacteroidales bacterium]|nr:DNA mismatch repair protein MutS [Bacteroidales bacterium]HOL97609.1 DNA mismatch repair protein MutS [Bacteroidales bacterium]HPD23300.1 DNA mismatch repair protein MutS [Bacteroidales bacterium]HRS99024.1 DNA mismatch repair protein MutS [Bacteroidales bacterium]HRT79905.1 DNA mismatch repair protein MutS [Bacteroidales bacterium]